jgi:hypothetical protein
MAKRKVSAREAVADIRQGMDDPALMKKYNLSTRGLQSLFDKLVAGGYIDLAEIEGRIPGFLGTVVISESVLAGKHAERETRHQQPDSKPSVVIFAQQAARDIRSGMDDSALMEKYRLSPKGLKSLFDKLISAGAITRLDVDRRGMDDHTVDLKEDMLSLGIALKPFDRGPTEPSTSRTTGQPDQSKVSPVAKDSFPPRAASLDKEEEKKKAIEQQVRTFDTFWYDDPLIVMLVLIDVFPVGFYALYRNSTLSTMMKAFIVAAWILLATVCLILIL